RDIHSARFCPGAVRAWAACWPAARLLLLLVGPRVLRGARVLRGSGDLRQLCPRPRTLRLAHAAVGPGGLPYDPCWRGGWHPAGVATARQAADPGPSERTGSPSQSRRLTECVQLAPRVEAAKINSQSELNAIETECPLSDPLVNPMNTATLTDPKAPVFSGPRPLHVVLVDEELPFPPTSGKRIRTLNLTRRLAGRHRLTYLCHRNADPVEAEQAAANFAELGIETVIVDRAIPAKSGPGFYARLALNLLSPLPYSVASHNSRALRRAIREYAASHQVDLWHCEWTPYAEPLRCLSGARRLVMAHNVESLIWQRYFENEMHLLKRWFILQQWRKFVRFERRALRESDRTVAVSPEDAALFQRAFGVDSVDVVDNGVDTEYFRPSSGPRNPDRILFLGSLDWRPNLDGVNQLLEHLYPAVRREW